MRIQLAFALFICFLSPLLLCSEQQKDDEFLRLYNLTFDKERETLNEKPFRNPPISKEKFSLMAQNPCKPSSFDILLRKNVEGMSLRDKIYVVFDAYLARLCEAAAISPESCWTLGRWTEYSLQFKIPVTDRFINEFHWALLKNEITVKHVPMLKYIFTDLAADVAASLEGIQAIMAEWSESDHLKALSLFYKELCFQEGSFKVHRIHQSMEQFSTLVKLLDADFYCKSEFIDLVGNGTSLTEIEIALKKSSELLLNGSFELCMRKLRGQGLLGLPSPIKFNKSGLRKVALQFGLFGWEGLTEQCEKYVGEERKEFAGWISKHFTALSTSPNPYIGYLRKVLFALPTINDLNDMFYVQSVKNGIDNLCSMVNCASVKAPLSYLVVIDQSSGAEVRQRNADFCLKMSSNVFKVIQVPVETAIALSKILACDQMLGNEVGPALGYGGARNAAYLLSPVIVAAFENHSSTVNTLEDVLGLGKKILQDLFVRYVWKPEVGNRIVVSMGDDDTLMTTSNLLDQLLHSTRIASGDNVLYKSYRRGRAEGVHESVPISVVGLPHRYCREFKSTTKIDIDMDCAISMARFTYPNHIPGEEAFDALWFRLPMKFSHSNVHLSGHRVFLSKELFTSAVIPQTYEEYRPGRVYLSRASLSSPMTNGNLFLGVKEKDTIAGVLSDLMKDKSLYFQRCMALIMVSLMPNQNRIEVLKIMNTMLHEVLDSLKTQYFTRREVDTIQMLFKVSVETIVSVAKSQSIIQNTLFSAILTRDPTPAIKDALTTIPLNSRKIHERAAVDMMSMLFIDFIDAVAELVEVYGNQ